MNEVKVTPRNIGRPEIRALYESAFPDEERIPYADLERLPAVMPIDFAAWYEGEAFIGLTIVYEGEACCWFWYFGVCEALRGQGYGQQILGRIRRRYAQRQLILDIESPRQPSANGGQRQRRYAFYLRNGFRDTGVERTFAGITYAILASGDAPFTSQDYDGVLEELHACWSALPSAE